MRGISREEAEIYSVQCVTIDEYLQGVNVILFFFHTCFETTDRLTCITAEGSN